MTGLDIVKHGILGLISFSGGLVVSSGLVALILGLDLIPRFCGITHTAHRIKLYEKCVIAGAILGNLFTVYTMHIPRGGWLAGCFGLFGGIFLGCWIIALTEILDMFPILSRKTGIKVGVSAIVLCTAIGKSVFSLLYYFRGW